MELTFEPLKNDLLLRAAWGENLGYFFKAVLGFANCVSKIGEVVERPPMWVMRQGNAQD